MNGKSYDIGSIFNHDFCEFGHEDTKQIQVRHAMSLLILYILCFAGIVVDVKEDENLDHHDDQASIKQFLVSSYKKNVYPLLKQEIQQNHRELAFFASRTFGSKWSFMVIFVSHYFFYNKCIP